MQTVLLLAAKAAAVVATGAHAVAGAAAAAGTAVVHGGAALLHAGAEAASGAGAAGGTGNGITLLKALRIGTSAVSAFSGFSQAQQGAAAMRDQAAGEEMQARQEFIQATDKTNEIARAFNDTVANQIAYTAASGLDVGSGSTVAARAQASADADRQYQTVRSTAQVNAYMRRARASSLRTAARGTVSNSLLAGVGDIGLGVYDVGTLGKKATA